LKRPLVIERERINFDEHEGRSRDESGTERSPGKTWREA